MTRSSRQKEKYEYSSELSQDNCTLGTAARTRPFSFDEIMLRRKNKKRSGDGEAALGEARNIPGKNINDKVSDHVESDRSRHNGCKRSSVKHASEDFDKVSSRKKETITSTKERKVLKGKDKESRETESKSKITSKKDITVDKAKRGEIDGRVKGKRKSKNWSDDSENEFERRHSTDFLVKDKHADRKRGNTETENKRKHRTEDDDRNRDKKNASRPRDSHKWHDSTFLERKEKKVSSQIRQDDSQLKRRRSRSREHDKDRSRRSTSFSPRAHKRTSYDVREHGEMSAHSSKDRSGRSNPDIDSMRLSSNGSRIHHRRHGGSASRLGGYSPRKRRTEAAVKTPSPPPIRSPEKRSAGWDFQPSKTERSSKVSDLSNLQSSTQTTSSKLSELSKVVPVTSSTEKTIVGVISSVSSPRLDISLDSVQLTQATRPSRRLYVENLPASASEESVIECLNNYILSSGFHRPQGSRPCISCIVHKEKNQALVEFITPEDASAALLFDGRSFNGSILRIRRPKDFVDASTGVPKKSLGEVGSVGSVSNIVKDSPHKIFIGGISKVISSKMLMEIACAFGPLRAYHYEVNADLNEPCAFLEYVDQAVTYKACAGLNGMRMGGQVLTVVQATPEASLMENNGNLPSYDVPKHAKPLLEKPTQVLKLKNVLDPEYLSSLSESELEDILEDIRLECSRFGTVKSVNVVKPSKTSASLERCEVVHDTVATMGGGNLRCDDINKSAEIKVGMHDDSGKVGRSDPSSSPDKYEEVNSDVEVNSSSDVKLGGAAPSSIAREHEEYDAVVEGSRMSEDNFEDNLVEDQVSQAAPVGKEIAIEDPTCEEGSSAIPAGFANQLNTSIDQLDTSDEVVTSLIQKADPEVGNKLEVKIEPKLEEKNRNSEGASYLDRCVEGQVDAIVKGKNKEHGSDQQNVFELGSVLVEYRRTEASCMAAHCLHGRLFDDRIVTVGYVNHDLYIARFPK